MTNNELNRLERIILNDNRNFMDNCMLIAFSFASVESVDCVDYKQLDNMKNELMVTYNIDSVQYDQYINTATEYNFWRCD